MEPYISLQGVSFSYHRPDGEIEALSDISFTVSKGEFVSLVAVSYTHLTLPTNCT